MINKATCNKTLHKPTCIDLILTSQPNCFQRSNDFKTGFSDFHVLIATEFKMAFQKLPPEIMNYQYYKNCGTEKFTVDVCKFDLNASDVEGFKNTVFCIFNKHATFKRKHICANEAPSMTKDLHKAIMKRFKLRNNF